MVIPDEQGAVCARQAIHESLRDWLAAGGGKGLVDSRFVANTGQHAPICGKLAA